MKTIKKLIYINWNSGDSKRDNLLRKSYYNSKLDRGGAWMVVVVIVWVAVKV